MMEDIIHVTKFKVLGLYIVLKVYSKLFQFNAAKTEFL